MTMLTETLERLGTCTDAVFACVQNSCGAIDACSGKAKSRCLDSLGGDGDLRRKLIERLLGGVCGRVDIADLLDSDSLGFGNAGASCATTITREVANAEEVVACVLDIFEVEASRIFALADARARELLSVAGVDPPCGLPESPSGCTSCCSSTTPKARKDLVACARAIRRGAAKLAATGGQKLGACANGLVGCALLKPGDAQCLEGRKKSCGAAVQYLDPAALNPASAKLRAAVRKRCDAQVSVAAAVTPAGQNLAALEGQCGSVGVDLQSFEAYATCLERHHACRLRDVAPVAIPRVHDLLSRIGLDQPAAACPRTATSAPALVASGADGRVVFGGIVKFLRPRVDGKATSAPFVLRRLIRNANRPRPSLPGRSVFQPGGSTRFGPITKIPAVAGSGARTAGNGNLLIQLRRGDGTLIDGFFELPNPPADSDGNVRDSVVAVFPDALSACRLTAEFSSEIGGEASAPTAVALDRIREVASPTLEFVELERNGIDDVVNLECPRSVAVSPDGRHVYATSLGPDDATIPIANRNCPNVPEGSGNSLAVFRRESGAGRLTFVESLKDGLTDGGGQAVDGLAEPREVAISSDGTHVYVAAGNDHVVGIFVRDGATGRLAVRGTSAKNLAVLQEPFSIAFSPDGAQLYVAGGDSDTIAVFARNGSTGDLSLIQALKDPPFAVSPGIESAEGLDGARSVRVSPDGAHAYAVGFLDSAVVVFDRDAVTGKLVAQQPPIRKGFGGIDLIQPFSVAISPDGENVYVACGSQDAIHVFARRDDGDLDPLEVLLDPDKTGLEGRPTFLSVSPDGRRVYVAGGAAESTDVVSAFDRDLDTGRLTPSRGGGGASTIAGIRALAVSPASDNVYVSGAREDALAVFFVGPEGP